MSTYARIADLPVTIESMQHERLTRDTSSGFARVTTEITLHGAGETGKGEDVWTDPDAHDDYRDGRIPDLAGDWTLGSLCERLGSDDVSPDTDDPNGARFRRWGLESAALDLALRQGGLSLADAVGRTPKPIRFVLSVRLGDPSTIEPIRERRAIAPHIGFKLDPVADWDDDLVHEIAALPNDPVRVLDFKALYHGTPVDHEPDPDLYRRCLAAFGDAWIEDPDLEGPAGAEVRPHMDRVTWDAPLHSVDDLTALDHTPRIINIKPCRFGALRTLMDVYDHCDAHGIAMYGGGFFELGVGRGQLQYLASLFHPDGPNDVSPRGYHDTHPRQGLPPSPLPPPSPSEPGFRLDDAA